MPAAAIKNVRKPGAGRDKAKPERKAARTTKDWKEEEQNEETSRPVRAHIGGRLTDPDDIVVGSSYKFLHWSDPAWKDKAGDRITVSCYYPTQGVIIDYPDTQAEADAKREAFKADKVPYIAILPGEPLKAEAARVELRKQGAKLPV